MSSRIRTLLPLLVILIGVVGLVGFLKTRPKAERQPPPRVAPLVRVVTVQSAEHRFVVETQGSVEARTESGLVAEVGGRVIEVAPQFADGGFFEKGDVLLKIDPRDYQTAMAQARATVAANELRVAQWEEEAAVARREWERMQRGEPTALVLREPQLAEAKAALAASQAALRQAERDLERTVIRAPYAGRVRSKGVDLGEYVNRGAPVGRIYAIDRAEIRLPIPNDQLAYLRLPLGYRGDERAAAALPVVHVRSTFAGETHEWQGRVVRTEGEIDARSRMLHVVAQVEDPYGRSADVDRPPLAVGMFVEAEIVGRKIDRAVVLPRAALRGRSQVLVVDDDDRIHFRDVEVLRATRESVVLGSGLEDGERVLLSNLDAVTDGMMVRPLDESQEGRS